MAMPRLNPKEEIRQQIRIGKTVSEAIDHLREKGWREYDFGDEVNLRFYASGYKAGIEDGIEIGHAS
jgi:hypothetical protein